MKIRLLLVDDHAVVRSGLRMLLMSEEDVEIVGEAGNAAEALELPGLPKPDVILMDIGLPDMSGIEATREIQAAPGRGRGGADHPRGRGILLQDAGCRRARVRAQAGRSRGADDRHPRRGGR